MACSHWKTCRHRACIALRIESARDRWIEALLGARLRFHGGPQLVDRDPDPVRRAFDQTYWRRTYRRWSQLYHGPTGSGEWHREEESA